MFMLSVPENCPAKLIIPDSIDMMGNLLGKSDNIKQLKQMTVKTIF